VGGRRNPGQGEVVPPYFEEVSARVLADEVRTLNARFDSRHTLCWLHYTEARLQRPPLTKRCSGAITIILP
jgi:hypothetical protein